MAISTEIIASLAAGGGRMHAVHLATNSPGSWVVGQAGSSYLLHCTGRGANTFTYVGGKRVTLSDGDRLLVDGPVRLEATQSTSGRDRVITVQECTSM